MKSRAKITVSCKQCNIEFEKDQREYNRQLRNGRDPSQFFCSRSCSCGWGNDNLTEEQKIAKLARFKPIATVNHVRGRKFAYALKKAKDRSKLKKTLWGDTNLTESYLQQIWDDQEGKCVWTKKLMILTTYTDRNHGLYAASLDRIDSSKGYVQGNVQFVLAPLNLAKRNYPDEEFIEFLTWLKK